MDSPADTVDTRLSPCALPAYRGVPARVALRMGSSTSRRKDYIGLPERAYDPEKKDPRLRLSMHPSISQMLPYLVV